MPHQLNPIQYALTSLGGKSWLGPVVIEKGRHRFIGLEKHSPELAGYQAWVNVPAEESV